MNEITALTILKSRPQPAQGPTKRVYEVWQVKDNAPNLHRVQAAYWTNPRIRAETYRKVGEIITTSFHEVYYLSQNHQTYSWGSAADPNAFSGLVTKIVAGPCRSTHVGDVVVCGEEAQMMNGMGWIDVSDAVLPGLL